MVEASRGFYLSIDRTITTGDYLMGSYWEWTTFPAESYYVGNFSVQIPSNVPPGQYYVGALRRNPRVSGRVPLAYAGGKCYLETLQTSDIP